MGDSPQQKAVSSINSTLTNYSPKYSAKDYIDNLDKYYTIGKNNINKSFAKDVTKNTGSIAQRLAGSGITSGATYEDSIKAGNDSIYKNKALALDNLEQGEVGAKTKAMDTFNNLDLQKIMLQLRVAGLLSNTNTWDDILGGIQTAGNIGTGLITSGLFNNNDSKASRAL